MPPRRDDRPVQDLGGALDVGDARLAAVVGRRERGHELGDPQRARLGRGPLRAAHLEAGAHGGDARARHDRRGDGPHVEAPADARWHQAHAAPGHAEGGVARGLLPALEGGRDVLVQHVGVQGNPQPRRDGVEAQGRAQDVGLDRHAAVLEGHLDRGGHDAQRALARLLGCRLGHRRGSSGPTAARMTPWGSCSMRRRRATGSTPNPPRPFNTVMSSPSTRRRAGTRACQPARRRDRPGPRPSAGSAGT